MRYFSLDQTDQQPTDQQYWGQLRVQSALSQILGCMWTSGHGRMTTFTSRGASRPHGRGKYQLTFICVYSVLLILYVKLVNQYAKLAFHLVLVFHKKRLQLVKSAANPLYINNWSLYFSCTLQKATAAAYEVEAIAWLFKDPLWFQQSRVLHLLAR